jgi:hypothetical protein
MKKRVGVITNDLFLYKKIALILESSCFVAWINRASHEDGGEAENYARSIDSSYDLCLWDVDSVEGECPEYAVSVGWNNAGLIRPFDDEELISLLSEDSGPQLRLGEKCVFLRGEPIRLTEVELRLLSCLVDGGGEYVSRAELIEAVWGEGADGGVLNVYVHYLREKLETEGEKIILSSRSLGYKIDRKYLEKREGRIC